MENNKKPDAENLLQVCDIYKSFGDSLKRHDIEPGIW